MDRRSFFLGSMLIPVVSFSQELTHPRIAILTDIVNAVGAAGKALSDLTNGLRSLVEAGSDAYNYVSAQRDEERLTEIVRRTGNLIFSQNAVMVRSLDEYLALKAPGDQDWRVVARNIESTLSTVNELLVDVQNEKGSFVKQDASLTLKGALASRSSLLGKLSGMNPPFNRSERVMLQKISAEYKVLIANAEGALKELNAYLRTKK